MGRRTRGGCGFAQFLERELNMSSNFLLGCIVVSSARSSFAIVFFVQSEMSFLLHFGFPTVVFLFLGRTFSVYIIPLQTDPSFFV